MLAEVRSGDRSTIRSAAIAAAKAAAILNVPVIMTSSAMKGNDGFINDIKSIFPKQDPILRIPGTNDAIADEKVDKAIRKYGREKLIIGGLWTSESFAETALSAIHQGYDVFGLIDACGDTSAEKHNYGVHSVLKAGLTPITWMSLASEWMHGWNEPAEIESDEGTAKYNVMLSYLSKL